MQPELHPIAVNGWEIFGKSILALWILITTGISAQYMYEHWRPR